MKKVHVYALMILSVSVALLVTTGCGKQEKAAKDASLREDAAAVGTAAAEPAANAQKQLPKLLDLGAHKCIPCQMMAPILEELTKEYEGRMKVEFIDVWENQEAGQKYGIQQIPTQIFYGSDGKELFRHVGFMSKDDILAKWAEFGYAFAEGEEH